jgi:hypothetical protein
MTPFKPCCNAGVGRRARRSEICRGVYVGEHLTVVRPSFTTLRDVIVRRFVLMLGLVVNAACFVLTGEGLECTSNCEGFLSDSSGRAAKQGTTSPG